MVAVLPVIPDNITVSTTILLIDQTAGGSNLINHGFGVGSLSPAGLQGDSIDQSFIDTNVVASNEFSVSNGGATVIQTGPGIYIDNECEIGCEDATLGHDYNCFLSSYQNSGLVQQIATLGDVNSKAIANLAEQSGFYSFSRVSVSDVFLYKGVGAGAVAKIAENHINQGLFGVPAMSIAFMAMWLNSDSEGPIETTTLNFSSKRISFFALHKGLTQAETDILYQAAYALRVGLGGGQA